MSFQQTFNDIRTLIQAGKINVCIDGNLVIEEHAKQATLKKVEVISVGALAFSIKLDSCNFPGQAVFNAHPSLHSACDAVAFCDVDGKPYIICCELKSREPTRHEVTKQFQGAHCFLAYLDTLLNQYCQCELISSWERRYFVFHGGQSTPLRKSPSHETPSNSAPERALFMPVKNGHKVYVRKLLGKPL